MKALLFLVLVLVLIGLPISLFFLSADTQIELVRPVDVIGTETPVEIRLTNPHGLRRLTVALEQGDERHVVFEENIPANRLTFWRLAETPLEKTISAGTKTAPALHDGPARLVIEAQSNDLRGKVASLATDMLINTQPPRVSVESHQLYINHGGSEMVVFTVSGYWTEAGVRAGPYTFRSFPFPGSPQEPGTPSKRIALFSIPWDVPANTVPIVYASNPAGAEATSRPWFKIFPKDFRTRRLDLPESFVHEMAERLDPGGQGTIVERFVRINSEMRQRNNQTLADLRRETAAHFLWTEPFAQLANSKVESRFADARDYYYNGEKIDHQTHLGFDLSVTANVNVAAANDGNVVLAEPLGIYGNCVVVDHGMGLQSVYAHLSEFAVQKGDPVKKGQTVGRSGQTGLAGGDHLHFSMLLDGVQVTPIEWWDAHWLQDRIFRKLNGEPPR